MVSKKQQARELYENGQKTKALSIVKKWPNLGKHRDNILRGSDCVNNPELYKQMGYDLELCRLNCDRSLVALLSL